MANENINLACQSKMTKIKSNYIQEDFTVFNQVKTLVTSFRNTVEKNDAYIEIHVLIDY